jgi:acyl-coenzyme A thioesterase PaaI-like protein
VPAAPIGSLHSSGLITLIDATGLAAVIAAASEERQFDGVTPLSTVAHLEFLAPATGRLTGHCELDGEDLATLQALLERRADKAQLDTAVEIVDEEATVVCRGRFTWKLRRASGLST